MAREKETPDGRNKTVTKSGPENTDDSTSFQRSLADNNEANRKGAVNTAPDGTTDTASQQQGQGARNAKDPEEQK